MNEHDLPQFSGINLSKVPANLDRLLADHRSEINALLKLSSLPTWQSLMQPLDNLNDELHRYWAPVSHLNSVVNTPELREVIHRCLPKLSDFYTELSHNQALYQAVLSLAESEEYQHLDRPQRKIIDNELRDFKLSGVALPPEQKKQFAELQKQLSKLTTQFEDNVLDATKTWHCPVSDDKALAGIPEHAVHAAKEAAEQRKLAGYVFTLEIPSYLAVITYADSRAFREEMYRAFNTRASDQGSDAGKYDNSSVMKNILEIRLQLANLLGFEHYADYALTTRMVREPQQAIDFLHELAQAALPKAKQELAELSEFARDKLDLAELAAWDIAYASEKLRQARYDISQEDLRPYFPETAVVPGLFDVVNRLFGITVKPVADVDCWDPGVRCYGVYDQQDNLKSYFYLDLYSRSNKRGGAWMDDHRARRRLIDNQLQLPIAFIVCNLNPPVGDKPALFSHDEVVTLFHEFGHALQHMLTTVDYADVAGINGIPWDAVELASQFLENWAWEKESLALIARHYKTGEVLPNDLYERMNKARNFQAAMATMRQLEFALFDMRLHVEFDPQQQNQIQTTLNEVRTEVCVVPIPDFNRFQHSFSHIFAGGYSAGYYSYKWAEVMAADAFSLFEERGIFDHDTAARFLTYILEPGGSEDPEKLFESFRGHPPRISALLKKQGIIA